MATSGTFTYSINRDTLIKSAFRTLGVFNDDSTPPVTDMSNSAQALNLMIKAWHTEGYPLWCVDTITLPLATGQTVYSIGPGGLINTYRPLRVTDGRIVYPSGVEVPLTQISKQEYNALSNKGSTGVPNSFYYDPQLNLGNLYVWCPATADLLTSTVKLTVQRPLMDMTSPTDDFDFPVEALSALKFGLASELVMEYDIPTAKAQIIIAKAESLKDKLFDSSVEEASTFFSPNFARR